MEWSAKQCQTDQPFGSWADDLANAFVRLEPRKIAEHPFQGTISKIDATPIRISRVTATKHRVLRLRSHIAHSTDDLCFINLHLEGVGRSAQRGHEQICGPGDLAVVDTTVNHKRILVCTRDLLGDSRNGTIAEIAFAAGFRDISHFNRLFKRSNGASPREFRHTMTSSTG